jgi:hypothetical protein
MKTGTSGKETYVAHHITSSDKLRGLRGLWQYLITRSQLKAKLEIERERSRTYADHRDRLPDDAELMDYEDSQGRKLWIRKNGSSCIRPASFPESIRVVQVRAAQVAEVSCLADDELTGEMTS